MLGTAVKPAPSKRQAWLLPATPSRLMERSVPAGLVTRRREPAVRRAAMALHTGCRARKSVNNPPFRIMPSVKAVMDTTRHPPPMASLTARVWAIASDTGRKATAAPATAAATTGDGSSLSMFRAGGRIRLGIPPAPETASRRASAMLRRSGSDTTATCSPGRTAAQSFTRMAAPLFTPNPPSVHRPGPSPKHLLVPLDDPSIHLDGRLPHQKIEVSGGNDLTSEGMAGPDPDVDGPQNAFILQHLPG